MGVCDVVVDLMRHANGECGDGRKNVCDAYVMQMQKGGGETAMKEDKCVKCKHEMRRPVHAAVVNQPHYIALLCHRVTDLMASANPNVTETSPSARLQAQRLQHSGSLAKGHSTANQQVTFNCKTQYERT